MRRRDFLQRSLVGGFGLGCLHGAARPLDGAPPPGGNDPQAMARAILDADDAGAQALVLQWLKDGLEPRDVLTAAHLAGLQEVDARRIGGHVHALMMTASAAVACAALPPADRALPLLFHTGRIKSAQRRDVADGDWTMPPPPPPSPAPLDEHVRAFRAAMTAWDEPAADAAVCALHGSLPLREFFEELWPFAASDFRVIGHKVIFAAQTFRLVEDIGWRLGRDAVRAVVRGVLSGGKGNSDEAERSHATAARSREAVAALPAGWAVGRLDHAASLELLATLRTASLADAQDAVTRMLAAGVGAASVWDGLRLCAFELLLRHPDIPGVHPVTSLNALFHAFQVTARETTRRFLLLQAAGWMVWFRDFLERGDVRDLRIDALRGRVKGAAADPFAERDEAAAASAAVDAAAADASAFARRTLEVLARKARHDHDYKFAVAAAEEVALASPLCRPLVAGASMAFLLREDAADHAVVERLRRGA